MARLSPADRFAHLLDAALTVFADRGVHRARMADVAQEMGVSPGTLYNYVESKDALFFLLLEHGLSSQKAELPPALPVPTPPEGVLFARLDEKVLTYTRIEPLERALATSATTDGSAEFRHIVTTLYDKVASNRRWVDLLERSSADSPEVAHLFLIQVRRALLGALTDYLGARMATGQLRTVAEAPMAARFLLETVMTFARRLPRDPDPEALPLAPDTVREEVIRLLTGTFSPHHEP